MTNKWLFCIVFALLLLMAGVMVLGAAQEVKNLIPNYNINAERVFEGVIESNGHIIEGFMYFPVKTRQGLLEVQVGPGEFFRLKNFDLVPGDNVRILGVRVVIGDRPIVLAREIRCARGVLILREDDGVPVWESEPTMQMDPERPQLPDDVCDATRNLWGI